MTMPKFGGDWTTDKLERLRKYLHAYMKIFTRNPGAQRYKTIYVDAFAGAGHRMDSGQAQASAELPGLEPDSDAEAYKKGSAQIALEVQPPFYRFVFIERDAGRVADLERLADEQAPNRDAVSIMQGEANDILVAWCAQTNWSDHRAVVFLDPYGMQVDWATLEALAKTQAVDLWILFPLGMAVMRLLTREAPPPPKWSHALTRFFGTPDWEPAFYATREELTLFGTQSVQQREADWDRITQYFVERLKTIFREVAPNPLALRNSTNTPIYLLCFAANNPKGAKTAVKIAQDILKP